MTSSGPRTTLGGVLRRARAEAGLSLRDVERRTGLSNAHLSQIETDTIAKPEMSILWELAALYGLDFARLLALAGHAGERETSGRQWQRMTVALRAMSELSPSEQAEALRFMAELKARRGAGDARLLPRGAASRDTAPRRPERGASAASQAAAPRRPERGDG